MTGVGLGDPAGERVNDGEVEKVRVGAGISVSFDRPKKRLNLHNMDCLEEASSQKHRTSV